MESAVGDEHQGTPILPVAKRKNKERKQSLLYLIQQFLKDEGLNISAQQLEEESQLSGHYCVCDNIDLVTILQEYETYYYARYQKYPKLCRAQQTVVIQRQGRNTNRRYYSKSANSNMKNKSKLTSMSPRQHIPSNTTASDCGVQEITKETEFLQIHSLLTTKATTTPAAGGQGSVLQEQLPTFLMTSPEHQELVQSIRKEIITTNLNVKWSDIIGLEKIKSVLKETFVYPQNYPHMFHGLLSPWKTMLLYGPPGTGKTMLAKAVASECSHTFFNISASSIVSKWRGDSEKLIRVLFDLACYNAPSIIFMDEIDAIMGKSNSEEHESARRLRAEILMQLDGLMSATDRNVFLLATTNHPWDLDKALIRRLEKRMLINLPTSTDRERIVNHLIPPHQSGPPIIESSIDYKHIAKLSEGYTGSDLKIACREAAMEALRQTINSFQNCKHYCVGKGQPQKLKTIATKDLETAIRRTRPTTVDMMKKYHIWESDFGSM